MVSYQFKTQRYSTATYEEENSALHMLQKAKVWFLSGKIETIWWKKCDIFIILLIHSCCRVKNVKENQMSSGLSFRPLQNFLDHFSKPDEQFWPVTLRGPAGGFTILFLLTFGHFRLVAYLCLCLHKTNVMWDVQKNHQKFEVLNLRVGALWSGNHSAKQKAVACS